MSDGPSDSCPCGVSRLDGKDWFLRHMQDRDGEGPTDDRVNGCGFCNRRPEPVVKAEALRQAALSFINSDRHWLERRANELDPPEPAEPTGIGAVVRDKSGGRWVRVDSFTPWVFGYNRRQWSELVVEYGPVTVLSEGVTD